MLMKKDKDHTAPGPQSDELERQSRAFELWVRVGEVDDEISDCRIKRPGEFNVEMKARAENLERLHNEKAQLMNELQAIDPTLGLDGKPRSAASTNPTVDPAAAPTPTTVQHRTTRRTDPLEAVLELARSRALSASKWTAVWNALVVLAQSSDRPAPLLGYTEGEGVKWQADDEAEPVRYLTRENFRDRWRRSKRPTE
jgi:hypothetical protein